MDQLLLPLSPSRQLVLPALEEELLISACQQPETSAPTTTTPLSCGGVSTTTENYGSKTPLQPVQYHYSSTTTTKRDNNNNSKRTGLVRKNSSHRFSEKSGHNISRVGYFRRSVRRLGTRWENWSGTPSFSMDEPSEVTKLIGVPTGADPRLWFFLVYSTFFISGCHILCGAISICVGKNVVFFWSLFGLFLEISSSGQKILKWLIKFTYFFSSHI